MRIATLLVPCLLAACTGDADLSSDAGVPSEGEMTQEATTLSVTLTSEPPAIGNSPSVTFAYATNKTATMTCRLDTQSYVRCPATAKSFSALAEGNHSFDLRATANGKQVAIPTYHFSIDTTPPVLAITTAPPASSNSSGATFAFTTGDATSVTCQLDGSAPAACTSPVTYSGLLDGSHAFTLRGTDAAGNTASVSDTWTVTTTAPTVTITGAPGALSISKTPTFLFVASAGTTACSVDLGPSVACTSPTTVGPLADGHHSFAVLASAGGSTGVASYSWTLDSTPPAVTTPTYYCDGSIGELDVTWTASDATSGIASGTCTYGGNTFDCTNVRSWSGYIAAGGGTFSVRYTDVAGNTVIHSRIINLIACQ